METINVNIAAIEEKIGKLQTLMAECEAINVETNAVVGSGMSIEVIEAVDAEYQAIKTAVLTLLDHSVSFFDNIKMSLVEADDNAANGLN